MRTLLSSLLLFFSLSVFGQLNLRMLMAGHDAVPEHFSQRGIIEVIQHEYVAAKKGDSIVKLNLRGTCLVLFNKEGYMSSKTESFSADPRSSSLTESYRVTCVYDTLNSLRSREENGSSGGRCYTTYDCHRFINGVLAQTKATQVWGSSTNEIIERYNETGKLVSQEWMDSSKVSSRHVYVYDEAGDIKIDSQINIKGEPIVTAHKYDKYHNLIEQQLISDGEGISKYTFEYTYNDEGLWTKRIMYADGKPEYIDELEYVKN